VLEAERPRLMRLRGNGRPLGTASVTLEMTAGEKLAAYRDEQGTLIAACTHLGCEVNSNASRSSRAPLQR
jgi:Rieske Fe-S protein